MFEVTKIKFFRILSIFLLISSLLPVVANNIPSPLGSFRFLWAPLWLLAVTFVKPEVYYHKFIIVLLSYGILSILILENILWINMNDWYKKMILEEFYALILVITVFSYFVTSRDFNGWANISRWSLILIVLTGIMTIVATSIEPTVARNSVNSFKRVPHLKELYDKTGCGGYGFAQALCLLFPILIYYIKFGSLTRALRRAMIFLVVFLFFVVLRVQVFANVIVSVIVILLSILGMKYLKRSILVISFSVIVAASVPVKYYSDFLIFVSNYFEKSSENYRKLNDLAHYLVNPNTAEFRGIRGRAIRYPMLFRAFIDRPFLGDASYASAYTQELAEGGHLHWMSRLTVWGIFGFLLYVFVLQMLFKKVLTLFDVLFRFYYLISIIAFVFLGLLKMIGGRENWIMLFVIIPGMYYFPLIKRHYKSSSSLKLN